MTEVEICPTEEGELEPEAEVEVDDADTIPEADAEVEAEVEVDDADTDPDADVEAEAGDDGEFVPAYTRFLAKD